MDKTTSVEGSRKCTEMERGGITMIVPVLLYKDLQGLSVGEHHICVDAEVEVAAGILTTQIPEPQDQKKTHTQRKI